MCGVDCGGDGGVQRGGDGEEEKRGQLVPGLGRHILSLMLNLPNIGFIAKGTLEYEFLHNVFAQIMKIKFLYQKVSVSESMYGLMLF